MKLYESSIIGSIKFMDNNPQIFYVGNLFEHESSKEIIVYLGYLINHYNLERTQEQLKMLFVNGYNLNQNMKQRFHFEQFDSGHNLIQGNYK